MACRSAKRPRQASSHKVTCVGGQTARRPGKELETVLRSDRRRIRSSRAIRKRVPSVETIRIDVVWHFHFDQSQQLERTRQQLQRMAQMHKSLESPSDLPTDTRRAPVKLPPSRGESPSPPLALDASLSGHVRALQIEVDQALTRVRVLRQCLGIPFPGVPVPLTAECVRPNSPFADDLYDRDRRYVQKCQDIVTAADARIHCGIYCRHQGQERCAKSSR